MLADLLRQRDFRAFALANIVERLAASAVTVLIGLRVYELTDDPLFLGWLGLVEAIPGVTLVLYGGHVADRRSRRRIVIWSAAALALFTAIISAASSVAGLGRAHLLGVLFGVAFLSAVARAFEGPAATGLEAQVVPIGMVLRGTSVLATSGRVSDVLGPVIGGFAWTIVGPEATFASCAVLFALASAITAWGVSEAPPPRPANPGASVLREIGDGISYVFRDQVLVGSMALDLFAVFFGGATALLPVFATDILHVGASGLGVLRAAIGAGSLVAAALAGRYLPERRAGLALFGVIAGFGVSMVVFGLSRSVVLSMLALFVAGLCDGTSVIVRRAILRLASPEHMRGRIAAVKSVFVGSSNEIGAFESGLLASWLGTVASVWSGGLATLAVVGVTAFLAPRLRRLDLVALAGLNADPAHALLATRSSPTEQDRNMATPGLSGVP